MYVLNVKNEGIRKKSFLVLLNHPLIGDVQTLNPLLNDLLSAHKKYLSNFK